MSKSVYILYINPQAKPSLGLVHKYTSEHELYIVPITSMDFVVDDKKMTLIRSLRDPDAVVSSIIQYVALMDDNFGRGQLYIKNENIDEPIPVTRGINQLREAVTSVLT